MTRAEFLSWVKFYQMAPFDDLHRFHRPAALISRSVSGGEIDDLLEWLQPQTESADGMTAADRNTMRAFGFSRKGQ